MTVAKVFLANLVAALAMSAVAVSRESPPPILTTPAAHDVMSYAEPNVARVTHIDLDLVADFSQKIMSGRVRLDIAGAPNADRIILDENGLAVTSVDDAEGHPLIWGVGERDSQKGAPLTIEIGAVRQIVIHYHSSPGARALQWLDPNLTPGGSQPYMYSEGEAINTRSWIPTQDSPGIRQTWSARITVPVGVTAVMSGERLTPGGEASSLVGMHSFRFRMEHPVPCYLIALAIGDIAFRSIDGRTGVYADPQILNAAATELSDTGQMIDQAAALYGSYRWGRYDVLVLPPSFPFGGMENPTLTFATATLMTGDKANIATIAHELAHSWSGNLVTNATWSDIWLNEGFTAYFQNRIIERVYGRERARAEADLAWDRMLSDIHDAGGVDAPATRLHGDPLGQFGMLHYTKGATFLRTIEYAVGRPRWDAYLRSYFDRNAFLPQTTAGFLADLRSYLIKGNGTLEKQLQLERWAYQPGLPENAVHVHSKSLAKIDADVESFQSGALLSTFSHSTWTTEESLRFLNRLPRTLPTAQMKSLDRELGFSVSNNALICSAWLELVIENKYEIAEPFLTKYLTGVGRIDLILPLYRDLIHQGDWGRQLATRIYATARSGYHPIAVALIDKIMASAPPD